MDVDYNSVRLPDSTLAELFTNSLFVLSTVMSVAPLGSAVCDAGLKAHSVDSGLPLVKDPRAISFLQASDEHGLIYDPGNVLVLGEKLLLIPGHCDPTVNLYDWLIGIRNGLVEAIWPVSARGMVY
jgi:3-hydroxy-D-aspartate aldolase